MIEGTMFNFVLKFAKGKLSDFVSCFFFRLLPFLTFFFFVKSLMVVFQNSLTHGSLITDKWSPFLVPFISAVEEIRAELQVTLLFSIPYFFPYSK